jgi:hypothetical protein
LGQEIVYCAQCQVQLRGRDFDQGEAFRIDVRAVCKKCAPEVIKSLPPDKVQILLKQMVVAKGKTAPKDAAPSSPPHLITAKPSAPATDPPRPPSLAPLWVGLGLLFLLVLGLAAWVLSRPGDPSTNAPAALPTPPASAMPSTTPKEPVEPKTAKVPVPPPKDPAIPKESVAPRDPAIPGLVGHWKLDDAAGTGAADSSGCGNRGALVNGPEWVPGKRGTALSFNGDKAIVTIECGPRLMQLHKSGLTVCAWVLARGAKRGHILDKSNSNVGWIILWKEGRFEFLGDQFQTSELHRISSGVYAMDVWHHVAATWDGGSSASHAHLYVNGLLADGKGVDGVGALREDVTTPLSMGNQRRLDRGFDGLIDDVRVYNRVLSPADILRLFNEAAK